MLDERSFTLRQIDQARSDFAVIADDLEFIKGQLARQFRLAGAAENYFSSRRVTSGEPITSIAMQANGRRAASANSLT